MPVTRLLSCLLLPLCCLLACSPSAVPQPPGGSTSEPSGSPGSPVPSPSTEESTVDPPAESTGAGSGGPSLAGLKPCELLSPSARSTAGLTTLGVPKTVGAARACDWTEKGTFGLLLTLDERTGLDGLKVRHSDADQITVGGHRALRVADRAAADGTCAVLLGVGGSASVQVDVSNTNFQDTDLACRRAGTVAELIEPALP